MKKLFYILPLLILLSFGVWYFAFSPLAKGGLRGVSDATSSEAEAAAPREGLVGHWTMDRTDINGTTHYDRSGRNHHGTIYPASSPATSTLGKINQAVLFDSKNGYIQVPNHSDFQPTSQFSVSVWVKMNALSSLYTCGGVDSGNMWVFHKRNANTTAHYSSYYLLKTNTNFFSFGMSRPWVQSVGAGDMTVEAGKWYHLVGTFNRPTISLYINGELDATSTFDFDVYNHTRPLFIGRTGECGGVGEGNWDSYFNGIIDDFRFYNRALSAQEVANLYNSAKITYAETPTITASSTKGSLVGHWTMDSGDHSRNLMYDRSGNNNHGTMVGTTTSTGRIGQARDFNGTSDYIMAPDSASLSVTGAITIAVWMTNDALTTPQAIVYKYDATPGQRAYALSIEGSWCGNNELEWTVSSAGSSFAGRVLCSTPSLTSGWQHVVATFVPSTSMKLYRNGVEISDNFGYGSIIASGIFDSNRALAIGAGYNNSVVPNTIFFNGKIDDVRVYDYAMSAQEVVDLYNSAKTNYLSTGIRTGLVGWWTMDNGDHSRNLMYDRSGYNNHGTMVGTTTSTGRVKEARSFNGTSDYITIGDPAILEPLGTAAQLTLSAWIKPNSSASPEYAIVSKYNSNATRVEYAFVLDVTNRELYIYVSENGGSNTSSRWQASTADGILELDEWHHVSVTLDLATDTVKFYVDGVNFASTNDQLTGVNDILDTTEPVRIGAFICVSGALCDFFDGEIDDVRIYNRALSAQEVVNLYSSAKANYK